MPRMVRIARGSAERLVLEFADVGAVERISAPGAEALNVEQRRALPDLLIGRERHPKRRSRQLGVSREMRDPDHDLGHARLVVGTEERVAAARDDVVPNLVRELRHRRRVQNRAVARKLDHASAVGPMDDRLDALTGRVGACVHVRDQADDVAARLSRCRRASPGRNRSRRDGRRPGRRPQAQRRARDQDRAGPACSARKSGRVETVCQFSHSAGTGRERPARATRPAPRCRKRPLR